MQGRFPVSDAGLAAAFGFVAECVSQLGFGQTVTHRLSVILDELCANMILHDPTLNDQTEFTVEVSAGDPGVRLTLSDPGQPFDPLQFRHEAQPEIGGHGITLVKGLAKSVSYDRVDNCNRMTVVVLDT